MWFLMCKKKFSGVLVAWLIFAAGYGRGAVPPPPRDLAEVTASLARAPEASTVSTTRPLHIVLVANRKDHGPHEHDYPRWMNRWKQLLDPADTVTTESGSRAQTRAANVFGPPGDLSRCPDGGAHNVTVETAADWPTQEQWTAADIVVAYVGTGRIWNAAKLADLENFLQRGGGFVAVHSAVIAEDAAADKLADILGLAWKKGVTGFRHGPLTLKLTDTENPILRGLPAEIPFIDETYWPLIGDQSKVTLLATADEVDQASGKPAPQPIMWTKSHGKGRVVSTILGHYSWTFDHPYFRIMLLRGMAWAAGESPYRFDPLVMCGVRVSEKKTTTSQSDQQPAVKPVPPVADNPNLLLWLDAADKETVDVDGAGKVTAWESKVVGKPGQFVSEPGQQPEYLPEGMGGKPALQFDGQDDLLRNLKFSQTTGEWTVILVAAPEASRGFTAFLSANQSGHSDYESGFNIDMGPRGQPQFSYLNLESVKDRPGARNLRTSSSPFGDANIITIATGGGTSRLWINGVEEASRGANENATSMQEVRIGARLYKDKEQNYFSGKIAEVLIYDRLLDDDEREGLQQYLLEKYGSAIKLPVSYELDTWDYLPAYDWDQTRRYLASIDDAVEKAKSDESVRARLETNLLKVLADPASTPASCDYICRRLAIVGTDASVPVLSNLLQHEQKGFMALFALERIPGELAKQALVAALAEEGPHRIEVIKVTGSREVTAAVDLLTTLLSGPDAKVQNAAAQALGEIGGAKAVAALESALGSAAGEPPRSTIVESLLKCAEQFIASGQVDEGNALYEKLAAPGIPEYARVAAVRAQTIAGGADAVPVLIEALTSDNSRMQKMASQVAAFLPGDGVTEALASHLDELTSRPAAQLVIALSDRGDPAARPHIVEAAKAGDVAVKLEAITALGTLGTADDVPLLVNIAAGDDPDFSTAAETALSRLQADGVDQILINSLAEQDTRRTLAAIKALGQRESHDALDALRSAAQSPDADIRRAAVKVLGESIATADDADVLTTILLTSDDKADISAAQRALTDLYSRVEDKDAWAEVVAGALPGASPQQQLALMRALSRHGGEAALRAVTQAAETGGEAMQDDYVRTLADWPTPDAAEELLGIAEQSGDETRRVLALRGYIRMAGMESLPQEQRFAMTKKALEVATRDDERRLAIGNLATTPSPETLQLLLPYLDNPALRDEAAAAALAVGEKLPPASSAAVITAADKITETIENPDLVRRASQLRDKARKSGN